jgi:uncharacterized protein YjbJ (UPF0337 family)
MVSVVLHDQIEGNVSNFEQITARWSCYPSFKAKGTVDDATAVAPVQALMMDRDRAVGSAKEIKGAVKEVIGKSIGDAKLELDDKADKIEGKVQNAIGGLKDTLKGK